MQIGRGGIRLFRAFGVGVYLDSSWFIFFFLVVWTFGRFYFPHRAGGVSSVVLWSMAIAAAVLLFTSVVLHELSHAITSNRLGFPIKRITLFIFGGVAHMTEEPNRPRTEFLVAAAGPASSVLLWLLFAVVAAAARVSGWTEGILVAELTAQLNLSLALFNLVPGFPLDGGRLLRAVLWWRTNNLKRATNYAAKAGEVFGFLLMLAGAITIFSERAWIGGIWYILIGLFIRAAAEQSYRHVLIEEVLEHISVSEIMGSNVLAVSRGESLDSLIEEKFLTHKFTVYPVLDDSGRVIGLIDLEQVKAVPREERRGRTARDVMQPIPVDSLPTPATRAIDVLRSMLALGVAHLPVIDSAGKLSGIVTRSDIMSMFQIRSDLGSELVV